MLCISWGGWGWGKPFPFAFLVHSDFPGTFPIIISYGAKSGLVGHSEMGDYCRQWCNFSTLRQSLLVGRARILATSAPPAQHWLVPGPVPWPDEPS